MQEQLSQVSQQKDYLMRTTEMYEADKRELEYEVRKTKLFSCIHVLPKFPKLIHKCS